MTEFIKQQWCFGAVGCGVPVAAAVRTVHKCLNESKQRKLAPITFDTGGEKLLQMSNSAKIF